jgi:hypothetical protein
MSFSFISLSPLCGAMFRPGCHRTVCP